jgi:hypothetical protein
VGFGGEVGLGVGGGGGEVGLVVGLGAVVGFGAEVGRAVAVGATPGAVVGKEDRPVGVAETVPVAEGEGVLVSA